MAKDHKKAGHMQYEDWINQWEGEEAPFHFTEPDEILVKNEAEIFGGKACKVFVPLCGKSEDMNWMYNKGHSVVGVEISDKACSDFFKDHKIEPVKESIDNVGNVYKSADERLQLYAADIFKVTADRVGTFDVVWDSAGLSVINKEDRTRYFKLLKSLMTPTTAYFITGADFDKSCWPGPPHPMNVKELTEMCGDTFNVELFHQMNARDDPADSGQGEKTPEGGVKDGEQEKAGNITDNVELSLDNSPYMYYTYHRLTQKK